MGNCPYCDQLLTPVDSAGEAVDVCRDCGGKWATAAALTALAREHPERLAPLDDAWPDRGGQPPLTRQGLECAGCGGELQPRRFPAAPDLELAACQPCGRIFFRAGQLRALHAKVSPATLLPAAPLAPWQTGGPAPSTQVRPRPDDYALPEPDEDAWEPDGGHAPVWGLRWAERAPGQPWLQWILCGMPLWITALGVVAAALFWSVGLVLAGLPEMAVPGLFAVLFLWPGYTLAMLFFLEIVWKVNDSRPELSSFQAFAQLLRVTPALLAGGIAAGTVCNALGAPRLGGYAFGLWQVLIYKVVLDVSPDEYSGNRRRIMPF
ncbi:MAG: zf-TFIIB domain-containing protein [Fimbriimonadaceae bacterium]|nr:zf-TFIIB domain-containing protein [Fimbriimonadaceae bacterium]